MEEEKEPFNPYVNAGFVVRMKIQDVGRLEQFIQSIFGAQLIYVEKVPKHIKLKIVKETERTAEGEKNGRFSYSAPAK